MHRKLKGLDHSTKNCPQTRKVRSKSSCPFKKAMEDTEVVIGTYENILLGFRVMKNLRNDVNPYSLEASFTDDAHRGPLKCMSISANGILASSSTDDSVRLHSLKRRREIGGLFEHNGTVNCILFYEKSYMFSASDDGKICMWKSKNWELLKTLKGHKAKVLSMAIHPSGKLAFSVSSDKSFLTWDLVTGKLAFQRKISDVPQEIHFTSNGDHYILVYQKRIEVCAIEDTQVVKETEMNWRINAFCHVQGDMYAAGGDDRHVFLVNVMTGDKVLTLDMAKPGDENFSGRVRCIAAASGDECPLIFVGTSNGDIKAFSVNVDEDEESSEELLSYEAGVRMTCMAVYRPASSTTGKENKLDEQSSKTGINDNDASGEENEDADEEEDKDDEKGLESYDEEEEEEPEEREVERKGSAKKKKKRKAEAHENEGKSTQDRGRPKKRKMKSPSLKMKKKKGKVK